MVPMVHSTGPAEAREHYLSADAARFAETVTRAYMSAFTFGISPASLAEAYTDWFAHLATSPAKQQELWQKAHRKLSRFLLLCHEAAQGQCTTSIEPLPQDRRFDAPLWKTLPFSLYAQGFLLTQQWWWNATTGVRGVTRHHEEVATFAARQWLDIFSPSNYVLTNPEVLDATMKSGGLNLLQGAQNWWRDQLRQIGNRRPEGVDDFVVGKNVAVTPGHVVFQNKLIELLQYAPATASVYAEPVLIVPSWIMKYYILDLSPQNSLVKYLVDRGHTVFMISWRNPDSADRDLVLDDYRSLGVVAALEAIAQWIPKTPIHTVGYCLGGTLLAIAAAHLARGNDRKIKTLTMLAAELDFSEPGELSLFIDESQIAYLEDLMADRGYLDGKQMAGAFALLNSKDLVWSKMVRDYLLGVRATMTDVMAWNSDVTRMPAKMHAEYLRKLYLQNQLAAGAFEVEGAPVALTDIRVPIFSVATERDHVSPWRSVYKVHLLTDADVTFVLTSGGHNVGIVNPPLLADHPAASTRSFRYATQRAKDKHVDADTWASRTPGEPGSWWPAWQRWLVAHSSSNKKPPPRASATLAAAPGSYVFET
jgi:polyhydroxyalkanoate synthase subunit PhaC